VLAQHFPELVGRPDAYVRFYHEAAVLTARLIAKWQAVGFAHGVMNSDNMSVLGMTLDYGPFGFLDAYNPAFICNHSDHQGRYAFHNQPDIGDFKQAPEARNETIRGYFVDREAFDKWAERYKARLWAEGSRDEGRREAERAARMRRVNPKYVLRNYLAHTAIQMATEQKDF